MNMYAIRNNFETNLWQIACLLLSLFTLLGLTKNKNRKERRIKRIHSQGLPFNLTALLQGPCSCQSISAATACKGLKALSLNCRLIFTSRLLPVFALEKRTKYNVIPHFCNYFRCHICTMLVFVRFYKFCRFFF